jgi:hypothetical protein
VKGEHKLSPTTGLGLCFLVKEVKIQLKNQKKKAVMSDKRNHKRTLVRSTTCHNMPKECLL